MSSEVRSLSYSKFALHIDACFHGLHIRSSRAPGFYLLDLTWSTLVFHVNAVTYAALTDMSTATPESPLAELTLNPSSTTHTPSASTIATNSTAFTFPAYTSFPPFYTLQPNLTTRARQLELWSALIISYCAHYRIFRLSLSSPPADLFSNSSIKRSLKPADVRAVLEHMNKPENGPRVEWIAPTTRSETSNTCYVYWKTPTEWADTIHSFVEETGQKGAVLTIYELREGESSTGKEWQNIDEALLRKVLNVLVKRGKAQIFGQEETAGVKFF